MLEKNNNYYDGVMVRIDARMWESHAHRQSGREWGYAYVAGCDRYGDEKYKVLWNNGQVTQESGVRLVINKAMIKLKKRIERKENLNLLEEKNKERKLK